MVEVPLGRTSTSLKKANVGILYDIPFPQYFPIVNIYSQMTKNKSKQARRLAKVGVRRPQLTAQPRAVQNEINLSMCSQDYAHVLLDPCGAPPACMPSMSAMRSRKTKYWSRGSLTTGTNGTGFLVVCPGLGVVNDIAAGSTGFVGFSSATTFVSGTVPGPGAVGWTELASNSDYANADFGGSKCQYRLVSCCARVRNTTQYMNRAGSVYALLEPDHNTLFGKTLPELTSYDATSNSDASTGEWHELIYTGPIDPREYEYLGNPTYVAAPTQAQPAYNAPCMVFALRSQGTNIQTYDFEVWANYEIIGSNVRGKTESYSDPVGLNVITNGVQAASASGGQGGHGTKDFLGKALSFIGDAAKKAITFVAPQIPGLIGAAVGGPAGAMVGQIGFKMASKAIMGAIGSSRSGSILKIAARPH